MALYYCLGELTNVSGYQVDSIKVEALTRDQAIRLARQELGSRYHAPVRITSAVRIDCGAPGGTGAGR